MNGWPPSTMPTASPPSPPITMRDADLVERRVEVPVESESMSSNAEPDRASSRHGQQPTIAADRAERRHDVAVEQPRRRQRFPDHQRPSTMIAMRSAVTGARAPGPAGRGAARQSTGLSHRSSLSVSDEHAHADQDHEADRRVGARQVVALGELVDELAEAAEIDQELDADDVDQREDQPEPQADEDRRQRRREQDLPELLRAA